MNPYADVTFTNYDLTAFSDDDIAFPPSAPVPPFNAAPLPTDQSEDLHCNHLHQTDESELCNPYAHLVYPSSVTVQDHTTPNITLVQSETLNSTENANDFLSADQSDQSDQPDCSNSHRLSIVSSQIPDLECSICFSQFNNAFRCPKMLQCGHTFCLECLARMNVKSTEPSALLCPFCRASTPLPDLGLPKLNTDPNVLSCLPSSMQRVYSVRFLRNKGRLQLKRPDGALTPNTRCSLDVGLPSPVARSSRGRDGDGVGGALFRLTGRPFCRAFLLMAVITMIIVLTAVIVFLLTTFKDQLP